MRPRRHVSEDARRGATVLSMLGQAEALGEITGAPIGGVVATRHAVHTAWLGAAVVKASALSRPARSYHPGSHASRRTSMKRDFPKVDAKYVEIDSEFGQSASGPEWAKWGPALKAFVDGLGK